MNVLKKEVKFGTHVVNTLVYKKRMGYASFM